MTTRNIIATIKHPDGTPAAGETILYKMTARFAVRDDDVIYPQEHTATTDANGQVTTALVVPSSGGYEWSIYIGASTASHRNQVATGVVIEAGADITLDDLLALNSGVAVSDVETLLSGYIKADGTTDESRSASTQSSAFTLDFDGNSVQILNLTGNVTVTTANVPAQNVANVLLHIAQDATGNRSVTWPSGILWPSGTAPELSTDANAVDAVTLWTVDGAVYGATVGAAFATTS